MKNGALFGPGGNSDSFNALNKKTSDAPEWLKELGLDAYEYEAGRGVNGSEAMFSLIGSNAKKAGIRISIHAPYFISLSSVEEEKRLGSARYIIDSARALSLMSGETMVIHAGSCAKIERALAVDYAKRALEHALSELDKLGLYGFKLGIETMGKVNQLGTLDEVLELCTVDETVVPVVDFGHMNARNQGGVFTCADDYKKVFDEISRRKGAKYAENLHCHFSKIEYTTGGEKRHLTFADTTYGPEFEPLMEAVRDMGISPTFICESDGTQAKDALAMKKYYLSLK